MTRQINLLVFVKKIPFCERPEWCFQLYGINRLLGLGWVVFHHLGCKQGSRKPCLQMPVSFQRRRRPKPPTSVT